MAESGPDIPAAERVPGVDRGVWSHKLMLPFASLETYNFRMLWFGQLGQASAMWAEQVARNWLTWQLTGSATALGLVNLARAIPLITLGLLGGVIADRFDKRKVLIVIQVWSLSIYIAMAILVMGGLIQMWHVYLTAFLLGGGMALNQPVRTSFIPQLLDGRLLVNAISLNSIAINITRLIGPAAIGFLIAAAGNSVGPAYIVSTVVYVFVIATTFMIRAPLRRMAQRPASFGRDFIDGFRFMLVDNRTVLALVVMAMGPLAFGFSYITLLPVLVTDVFDMGSGGFGTMQSIAAIGALVGGFVLAARSDVPYKGRMMMVTGIGYGVVVILLGVIPFPVLAFSIMPLIGAAQTMFRTANNTTLLEITPANYQGRVVSITFLDMGMQSAASIIAGVVTDAWGVSAGLFVLGAVCIAFVGLVGLGVPSVRRL